MFAYILITVFLLLFRGKKSNKYLFLAFIILFIVSGFRSYSIGIDTMNYMEYYLGNYGFKDGELGYKLLFTTFYNYGLSYRWILIALSFIYYILLFLFAKREFDRPIMIILFFFILGYNFYFYNISRQMVAANILLFAYQNIERNGKLLNTIAIIFAASIVHISAIFAIILLFINKVKIKRELFPIILIFTFILPFIYPTNNIVALLTTHIDFLSSFETYVGEVDKNPFSLNRLAMNFLYSFIALRYRACSSDLFYKSTILGLIILNVFSYSGVITRMAHFFTISQIVFMPRYYVKGQLVDKVIALTYGLVIFAFNIKMNTGAILPYSMGWF